MNKESLEKNLKLIIEDRVEKKLEEFMQEFVEYNSHTNLMSKNDVSLLFEKHIFDSLALNLFLQKYNLLNTKNIKMLDIGTGGGFPSIPVSIVFSNIDVVALDSICKKIDFIRMIKTKLGVQNINPVCSRVEDLDVSNRESFDIVTSRAVSDLNVILEYSIPYLQVGSYFIAYKSKNVEKELEEAKTALKLLGARVVDKIEYKLPLENDFTRYLIIIKKEKHTPKSYPRKNGLPKKSPLS